MSQASKKFFIGLTAIKECPHCHINSMPFLNMAMCNECSSKTLCCQYCGEKESQKGCKCPTAEE